ncbi:MAG: DUF3160 domain-containing protein [Acidobacteriota bacterium]
MKGSRSRIRRSGSRRFAIRFCIVPALLILVAWLTAGGSGSAAAGETPMPPPLTLVNVERSSLAAIPPPKPVTIEPKMNDVANTSDGAINIREIQQFLGVKLSLAQRQFLDENKFLLIPKNATRFRGKVDILGCASPMPWDEMLGIFDSVCGESSLPLDRRPENARFVTPDVVLHGFHKFVENSLEEVEKSELAPTLRRFLQNARDKAIEYRRASSGTLAEHYGTIAAQLTVPLVILKSARWPDASVRENMEAPELEEEMMPVPEEEENQDSGDTFEKAIQGLPKELLPPELMQMVAGEIKLIYEASDVAQSPLYGIYDRSNRGDYTQYTPRSHYAKSSILRSYFRAMMYLGRNGYTLANPDGLTDAMLLAHILSSPGAGGKPIVEDWRRIAEITQFFAGEPDDVSYPEWREFLQKTLGMQTLSPRDTLDETVLKKLSGRLGELRPPRILSEVIIDPVVLGSTKDQLLQRSTSFRIFSQRFTFDGWVFSRLTAGQEKTDVRLPSTPTSLFIPAAMGCSTARDLSGEFLKTAAFTDEDVSKFLTRLDLVAADISKVKDSEWFGSLGSSWLGLLGTLRCSFGKGFPLYMQGPRFPLKQLQTFLGSYTELKHDTLLYAKQNYAEFGDGGDEEQPPPVPKGFVEPNLRFWYWLQRLVDYTFQGFAGHGILESATRPYGPLERFKQIVDFYTILAEKELRGEAITEDDYERLRIEDLAFVAKPYGEVCLEEKDLRSGLIADIHTDVVKQQVLYEATGEPYVILGLVGNENSPRVVIGVAFNHYELNGALARRLSDADWQQLVYEKPADLPAKPLWYQSLETR